jgi:hypothetical protein
MKICPSCRAEIRQAARVCYCYHSFDPQPLHTPTTGPPPRKPSQSTSHLGRIVLYGIVLVIMTITLVLIHNTAGGAPATCRHNRQHRGVNSGCTALVVD